MCGSSLLRGEHEVIKKNKIDIYTYLSVNVCMYIHCYMVFILQGNLNNCAELEWKGGETQCVS